MPDLQILFNRDPIDTIPISAQTQAKVKEKVILPQSPYPIDFLTSPKVNDKVRGYLIYNGTDWDFILPQTYKMIKGYNERKRKNLALILESPHKNEYDKVGNIYVPIAPAMGETGVKLRGAITKRKFIALLDPECDYEVKLFNAVQYQCSCYNELIQHNPDYELCHSLRNRVFKLLWKSKANDFIIRITRYKPDIIVNCCTGGFDYYNKSTGSNVIIGCKQANALFSFPSGLNRLVDSALGQFGSYPFSYQDKNNTNKTITATRRCLVMGTGNKRKVVYYCCDEHPSVWK